MQTGSCLFHISTNHLQFLVNTGAVRDAREERRCVLDVLDPNDEVGGRTEGRLSFVLELGLQFANAWQLLAIYYDIW